MRLLAARLQVRDARLKGPLADLESRGAVPERGGRGERLVVQVGELLPEALGRHVEMRPQLLT